MEWIALLVVFGLALAVAFAVGYRNKAYSEFVKKRDEVAALRRQLADLEDEKASLDAERASIRRERDSLPK